VGVEKVTITKKSTLVDEGVIHENTSFPASIELATNENHLVIVEHDGLETIAIPVTQQSKSERALAIALPGGFLIHGIDRAMGSFYTFREKEFVAQLLPTRDFDIEVSVLVSLSKFVHTFRK